MCPHCAQHPEYVLPHVPKVHVYQKPLYELQMPPYFRHTVVVPVVSALQGFHHTWTIVLSCLLCISIHQCFPPPHPQHIYYTRSTECCNSWSLLTHHQETLWEQTRGLRVPVLPLQTAMSLHQWVRTSVSHPSGPSDCASRDPHKDQVASSRVLVSCISIGHGLLSCLFLVSFPGPSPASHHLRNRTASEGSWARAWERG